MRALVTGGTGCVGSALVERLLEKGFEVRALARKSSDLRHLKTTGAEIVFGDVTDYESLAAAARGVDVVFHAAAKVTPGWGTWEEFEKTTVRGTENLLKAAAAGGATRFLQVSSFTVYGDACVKGDVPADETTECAVSLTPKTYYDYAKLLAERTCWEYHRQGQIPVSMIRIGIAYGPRDRLTADRLYIQTLIPLVVWPGKANPKFAVIYTSDVAELAILAATTDKAIGQVYNVAPPQNHRMKDLTRAMMKAQGGPKVLVTLPFTLCLVGAILIENVARLMRTKGTPFLNRNIMLQLAKDGNLDGTKARTELGWAPRVSLEDGMHKYVQWRRHRKTSPQPPPV